MSGASRDYVERRVAGQTPLWRGDGPLLQHLDLELTERCNNDCLHCCIALDESDQSASARELRAHEIEAILDHAASLGALSVRFTGGEPLLRHDFERLYRHARGLGLKVRLFTNARLVSEEIADLLQRVPPLEVVEVTVYGMHARSSAAVTRPRGAFAEARRGIARLLERGVPLVVKGVVLPPTLEELDELDAWAADDIGMHKPPSQVVTLELRGRRDSEPRNRRIAGLRLTPHEVVQVLSRRRETYVQRVAEFCGRFGGPPGEALFECGAGHGSCIDAYGRAQMCLPLRHPDTVVDLRAGGGEVEPERLTEALTTVFPRVRATRATNPDYLRRCARCFLKGLCEQCPARSWSEHGTLDTPVEYLCEVTHEQARDLGLLASGEHTWEIDDWKERVERL